MNDSSNPLSEALLRRGVNPPETPVDLSEYLASLGVNNRYVICITGRCGSTWLAAEIAQLGCCGNPREYFSEEAIPYYGKPDGTGGFAQFVTSIIEDQRKDEFFGFKIDSARLLRFARFCDLQKSFVGTNTAWIDMRRINLVKQAFSFARAKKTGVWHVESHRSEKNELIRMARQLTDLPDSLVWREIHALIHAEQELDAMYARLGVRPLQIFYEELLDSKPQVLQRVLAHIGVKIDLNIAHLNSSDLTIKIASDEQQLAEHFFIERNAQKINDLYQGRMATGLKNGA